MQNKKTPSPFRRSTSAAALLAAAILARPSLAHTGATANTGVAVSKVVRGSVTVQQSGASTVIHASNGAIIDYTTFNLSQLDSATFVQPSSTSRVLNRITSNVPSTIDGRLSANGIVYFVNPAGVEFGPHATINATSFVAAAANLSDQNFIGGIDHFSASGTLTNQGSISAGNVTLVGQHIDNAGTIVASGGLAVLQVGDNFYLKDGDTHVMVDLPSAVSTTAQPAIQNTGSIKASRVVLGAGDAYAFAISQTGTIQAPSVAITAKGGQATVGGSIDASSKTGKGGSVSVLASSVVVQNASINASGKTGGGTVLIGGDLHGAAPTPAAKTTVVSAGSIFSADATSAGNGGEVVVWSADATVFHGLATARGGATSGNGGLVETSGRALDVTGATVLTTAPHGKIGTWLLDPAGVIIDNGATSSGVYPGLVAVDVMVTQNYNADGTKNGNPTSASAIATSQTPIAPTVTTTTNSDGTSTTVTTTRTFELTSPVQASSIDVNQIDGELNGGASVLIQTDSKAATDTSLAGGTGSITLLAPISKTAGGDATLTLEAYNGITIASDITSTVGKLNVQLTGWKGGTPGTNSMTGLPTGSTLSQTGSSGVTFPASITISTNGGSFATSSSGVDAGVAIDGALNAGSNVTILTTNSNSAVGILQLGAPVFKTTGGDATLTLTSSGTVQTGYSIISTSGKLNLDLTSGVYPTVSPVIAGASTILGTPSTRMRIETNGGSFTSMSPDGDFYSYFEDSNPADAKYGDSLAAQESKTLSTSYKASQYFGYVYINTPIITSGGAVDIESGSNVVVGTISSAGVSGAAGGSITLLGDTSGAIHFVNLSNQRTGFVAGGVVLERNSSIDAGTGDVTITGAPVVLSGNSINGGNVSITALQSPETIIFNKVPTASDTLPDGAAIPSSTLTLSDGSVATIYYTYKLSTAQIVVTDPVDSLLSTNTNSSSTNPSFLSYAIGSDPVTAYAVGTKKKTTATTGTGSDPTLFYNNGVATGTLVDPNDTTPVGGTILYVPLGEAPLSLTGLKGETVSPDGLFFLGGFENNLGGSSGVAGNTSLLVTGALTPVTASNSFAVTASQGVTFTGSVRLFNGYKFNVTTANAPITFNGGVDGQADLILNAGTGSVTMNGAIGYVSGITKNNGTPDGFVNGTAEALSSTDLLANGLPNSATDANGSITAGSAVTPVPLNSVSIRGGKVQLSSVVSNGEIGVIASKSITVKSTAEGSIPAKSGTNSGSATELVTKDKFYFNMPVHVADFSLSDPIAASPRPNTEAGHTLYEFDQRSLVVKTEAPLTDVTPRLATLNAALDQFTPTFGTDIQITANLQPLSIANVIAGAVPQEERNPEESATVSGSVARQLQTLGIFPREITQQEEFESLLGRAVYDDVPRTPQPRPQDHKVATARLSESSARAAVAAYRVAFMVPVIDKSTGQPARDAHGDIQYTGSRQKEIKATLANSYDAFIKNPANAHASPAAFRQFIETDAGQTEARQDVHQISEVFRQVSELGLNPTEQRLSMELLVRDITPRALQKNDMEAMIQADGSAKNK